MWTALVAKHVNIHAYDLIIDAFSSKLDFIRKRPAKSITHFKNVRVQHGRRVSHPLTAAQKLVYYENTLCICGLYYATNFARLVANIFF